MHKRARFTAPVSIDNMKVDNTFKIRDLRINEDSIIFISIIFNSTL